MRSMILSIVCCGNSLGSFICNATVRFCAVTTPTWKSQAAGGEWISVALAA